MGAVEDLVELVATASTTLTKGSNLFAHVLPESSAGVGSTAQPVVAVEEVGGGGEPIRRFGANLPAFTQPTFTIVCRSTDGVAGLPDPRRSRGLMTKIFNTVELHPANSTTSTSGIRYTFSALEPGLAERDERGRYVWVMSVSAFADPSTST